MKQVIVLALVTIISLQVSAQSATSESENSKATVAVKPSGDKIADKGKVAKASQAGLKKSAVANKKQTKKASGEIEVKETDDKTVTLSSQSEHKAKSTFAEMLEKRMKADAAEKNESTATSGKNR